jgi:hypothetical protein
LTTKEGASTGTRFDRTRRNVLIGIVLAVVLIGTGSVAGLVAFGGTGARRGTNATPRVIDVWAVYPDETLRYVEIIHLAPVAEGTEEAVDVAGPLVNTKDDVTSLESFGGEVEEAVYAVGPGEDSERVYPLVTIRPDGSGMYGLDVISEHSPYIAPNSATGEGLILSLGTQQQSYYEQFIVAVALPPGANVTNVPNFEPYREARVGGWWVYYFDTTNVTGEEVIRLHYDLAGAGAAPPELDPWRIDDRH